MSRQVVFKCEADGKEIGRKKHITLMLNGGPGTGIAIPTEPNGWKTKPLGANFIHFHDEKCIAKYFAKHLANAK